MRKLKLQVQLTIDGYISGKNGEMDWMKFPWSEDIKQYVSELNETIDTILLGRKLAEGFIPHWEEVAKNPKDPEYEGGIKYTNTPKIVFSKTITTSQWENTIIVNGDFIEEIKQLKNQKGNDLIVYGGGTFVSSLIKNQLIDEFHLFINPTAIGDGKTIFKDLKSNQNLFLKKVNHFDCGIVVLHFSLI